MLGTSHSIVIACDKRKAFAQGSASDEAIQFLLANLDCFANARNDAVQTTRLDGMIAPT
jgi:hypothetical protein